MKLLLDNRGKVIYIGGVVEPTTIDDVPAWKIGANFAIDDEYTVTEVTTVPIEIIPQKYFYLDGAFQLNPNYVESYSKEYVQQLENKLNEVQATIDFLLMQ